MKYNTSDLEKIALTNVDSALNSNQLEMNRFVSELNIQPAVTTTPLYIIYWTYLKWRGDKDKTYISYHRFSSFFPVEWTKKRAEEGYRWYVSSKAFNISDEEKRYAFIYILRDREAERRRKKCRKSINRKNIQV